MINDFKQLKAHNHCHQAKEMDQLPNKVLLHIFSHLSHKEILKSARVCKKWRTLAYDSRLWKRVCLRPVYGGLQLLNLYFKSNAKWEMLILEYSWVSSMEALLALISARFGPSLTLMELQTDQITAPVLHELATKCPNLQYLTLDFSSATQLHDFADLQTFPARLHSLTICLSENIFLEGFLRKIYSFIGTVEVLHVIGTFEKWEEDEEEVYETINISKLKSHTPNLRVLNLWGIPFVTDEHIESISSSLPHLECLSVNFCQAVNGSSLKSLLQRCKRLRSLHMEQTTLDSKAVMNACWDNSVIEELNIAATDISSECLIYLLSRLSNLRWLRAAVLEHFTDQVSTVLEKWIQSGNCSKLAALDLDNCDSLSEQSLIEFLNIYGEQLLGLNLGGNEKLLEQFWNPDNGHCGRLLSESDRQNSHRSSDRLHFAEYCQNQSAGNSLGFGQASLFGQVVEIYRPAAHEMLAVAVVGNCRRRILRSGEVEFRKSRPRIRGA
ncbi:putative F-box domain protein [Trichinella spiralis]|uniref:putative F-box domain protein n=1 Tax=Trichinella spiralis TaxID=6334 RepID=UPI0001EFB6DE|nr:putative F-box domain protein [Trichinella spiralis]